MEYYNNTLCVEAGWLIDNGIMSESNYKTLAYGNKSRDITAQINIARRACRNTPALVSFESIPGRFRQVIERKLGTDPYVAARTNQIEERIAHNAETSQYFDNYLLADGRHLPARTRSEYYANAIILNAIHELIINKRAKRAALGHKAPRAWEKIAASIEELDRSKYPHSLPANPRSLEKRYKRYRKEGIESLVHKNYMNKFAAKVDDEVKESMMVELISDPRNFDNEQVRMLYNLVAEKADWKKITASTVAVWRDKLDLVSYAGRRGSSELMNKKAMQVKRKTPTYPLYYWTLDGWDIELLYQQTIIDKKGHSVTTYHNRPTVVVVLDACLKYPIGYAVGTHETPELTKAALRNAARHTAELFGDMHRSNQIQSDHYAIKKLTPAYEAMADKVTPARVKNAKSKIVEPYFNAINKKYCQLMANWSGFGITSDRDKQPNVEYLNKYKTAFPDFDGVVKQVAMVMERERMDKRERYLELWGRMPDEHRIKLTTQNYLLHFGETTGFTNRLEGSGLNPTILGEKRAYDSFDLTFRKHFTTDWEVRYDPEQLDKVLAVNADETLQFMLEEKFIQPMALRERKPGDSAELERVKTFNKALTGHITETRAVTGGIVRDFIEEAELGDTLKKLLLADSQGQHKDRRNEGRELAKAGKKVIEKSVRKEQRAAEKDWNETQEDFISAKTNISKYLD